MRLEVGDKVKFLNEQGGGIVTRIISPSLVSVMIEEGFEIPTAAGDLIKMEPDGAAGRLFQERVNVIVPENNKVDDSELPDVRLSALQKIAGKKEVVPGVYLAFIPRDQRWLITGSLDIYLLNHTDAAIQYTYYLIENDGSYTGMDTDSIPPREQMFLQTIDREEIRDWNQGVIQVLFFQEAARKVLSPVSFSFHVKESRFLKEEHYVTTPFSDSRMLLTPVAELSRVSTLGRKEEEGRLPQAKKEAHAAMTILEPALIDKHKIADKEAEIDLHIEELVEDEKGLDAEQILGIQLDYFKRCLDSAIERAYRRVVFIHGVGSGTLKSALRQLLDAREGLQHQRAPMAKYGVGAIEVILSPQDKR